MPDVDRELHRPHAGPGAGDRPHRFRQVDDAGGDHRHGQPQPARPHHDGRGPRSSSCTSTAVPGQPARGRAGHPQLPHGAQARAAPGPGRHPRRRAPRPGDDLGGPDRGRDRPPRLRDAAHPVRRRTIDRIIDVFPPHQQGQVRTQLAATLQGVVCQTLVKTATARAGRSPPRSWSATPAIRAIIREGKIQQIQGSLQAGAKDGMQTLDSAPRRAGQHRADHLRRRARALLEPRRLRDPGRSSMQRVAASSWR